MEFRFDWKGLSMKGKSCDHREWLRQYNWRRHQTEGWLRVAHNVVWSFKDNGEFIQFLRHCTSSSVHYYIIVFSFSTDSDKDEPYQLMFLWFIRNSKECFLFDHQISRSQFLFISTLISYYPKKNQKDLFIHWFFIKCSQVKKASLIRCLQDI